MSDSLNDIVNQFKDLSDLEFEILFVDDICKKLKRIDKQGIRSESLLIVYISIIDTLKKFKLLATDGGRLIPHEDVIDLILSKGEGFLTLVANDNSKASYVQQSLSDLREWSKSLLLMLKVELLDQPKYTHLKK